MPDTYVAVVGAINIDIWGKSNSILILHDSNPGEIHYSFGGVGRNIAHNLSLMGQRVSMLTAIGDDHWGPQVRNTCAKIGIDLSHAFLVPGARTGTYLAFSGPDGDMAIAMSDMAIAEAISRQLGETGCKASVTHRDMALEQAHVKARMEYRGDE